MRFSKEFITIISNYINENGEQGKYKLLLKPSKLKDKTDLLNCIKEIISHGNFKVMSRPDNYSDKKVRDLFNQIQPADFYADSDDNVSDTRDNKSIVYILTLTHEIAEKYGLMTPYGVYIKILFIAKSEDYSTVHGIVPNRSVKPKAINIDALTMKITFISAHDAKRTFITK